MNNQVYNVYLENGEVILSLDKRDLEIPCIDYLHFLVGAGEEPIGEMFIIGDDTYLWDEDGDYEMIA